MFQAQHRKPRGFNKKPAKRAHQENKIALGARHEQKLKEFETAMNKTLPTKERQLATVEKQIERLKDARRTNGRLNAVEQNELYNLKISQRELLAEIEQLQSRADENAYHLKTAPVIAEYNADLEGGGQQVRAPANSGMVSLEAWLKPSVPTNTNGPNTEDSTLNTWIKSKRKANYTSGVDRRELLEAWCLANDANYVTSKPFCHEQPNKCPDPDCGAVNQIANAGGGIVNCAVCGTEIDVSFAPRHTSFKETKTTELVPEFPYKRINHFQEWLSQIQGKQNTEIVDKVFTALQHEFRKHRIKDFKKLTPAFVKQCLKKHGFTKYYEHAEYIIHHFNGLPPPVLTVETEEEFREMFKEIQIPFARCKPAKRKNFLSYSYIFHQFAMLTGEDHLLDHFPLLKSRQKLKKQDDIWQAMCKMLKWEFIPTV
jgi:hypothetical protein